MSVVAVIPARYGAMRFPGKPLAPIAGKPMIQHVADRARQAAGVTRVIVATDDERIREVVLAFGGEAVMTRGDHRCGTERVAEVARQVEAEIYVNVQGDEPMIEPAAIEAAIDAMYASASVSIATLAANIRQASELGDPNVVKVVINFDESALYFSRAPIPWVRDATLAGAVQHYRHIGLYAFRRDALLEYPTLPPGILERAEQLEQLRWIENGYPIGVVTGEFSSLSVDAPEDVAKVEEAMREREKGNAAGN
jgi:3-deoxy-manno-octulosonate cytidylyltransferase (CMP-KDO synthetase)